MKRYFRLISLFTILALVISFSLVGCASRQNRPDVTDDNELNRNLNYTGDDIDLNRNLNNDLNRSMTNDSGSTSGQSNIIAKKIEDFDEVNKATVVITGETALVGVDIKSNLEGEITNSLKDKIEETVREYNKNIKRVSVTADPDLFSRIRNIGVDINNGRPLSGFANEIEEILRRINPMD